MQGPEPIRVCQGGYIDNLQKKYNRDASDSTFIPTPIDADIRPALENEATLKRSKHNPYQKQLGELV